MMLTKDWDELVQTIPEDLDTSAQKYGALSRRRGVKSASDLLRLILIYAIVCSLLTTALWGVGLKICDISRQAVRKRVLKSSPWLRHLLTVMLHNSIPAPTQGQGLIRRLVLRDASTFSRPGSPGTEWRLHLSWHPFHLQPAQVTLSDEKTGEGLEDAGLQAGDLVIADRAHGIWRAIQVPLAKLAFFIIRLTWSNLPLLTPEGQCFDLIVWLKSIPKKQSYAEISVIAADDPEQRPLRLVVSRLPAQKAAEARERVHRQARKKNRPVNPKTLLAAEFCILLTNLPVDTWPIDVILAFYRIRWQVEWCFRRWKSLCHLDQLPAYPAQTAEPVLLAKLLIILFMQQRLAVLPWSEWWTQENLTPVVSPLVSMVHGQLCELIRPSAVALQLLRNPTPFQRHLRASRRQHPLQLADAARRFADLLNGIVPLQAPA